MANEKLYLSSQSSKSMPILVEPKKFIDVWKSPPNLPEFQRGKVWDDYQKFELVMSTFLGYPVGSFSIHIDSTNEEWLLDGQQRLDAIQNMFIPTTVFNWAVDPNFMAISSSSPYHSLTPAQKMEHLTVTLSYLGYRWIRKIYDDTHSTIEQTVAKHKGTTAADKETRFKKRMSLRKKEVERLEKELHLFKEWNDGNVTHQPMSVDFLKLRSLFLGLGKVTKITGENYTQSDLENMLFGGRPADSKYFDKDMFFDDDGNYDSKNIGEILMEIADVAKGCNPEDLAKELQAGPLRGRFKTQQDKSDFTDDLNANNFTLAKNIHEMLIHLNQYFSVIQNHKIGQLSFKEDISRRITFEDQMKVFELINEGGTKLTEIELLVVRPAWRKTIDISGHAGLMQMIETCKDELALLGPNNKPLNYTKIARWQIAACYSLGFKKRFANRKLDHILG